MDMGAETKRGRWRARGAYFPSHPDRTLTGFLCAHGTQTSFWLAQGHRSSLQVVPAGGRERPYAYRDRHRKEQCVGTASKDYLSWQFSSRRVLTHETSRRRSRSTPGSLVTAGDRGSQFRRVRRYPRAHRRPVSFSAHARPGYARCARRLRRPGPALRSERRVDYGDGQTDVSDGL